MTTKMKAVVLLFYASVAAAAAVSSDDLTELAVLSTLGSTRQHNERNLQGQSCVASTHGRAQICTERTAAGNLVTYNIPCPMGVTDVDECLRDGIKICYQFNSIPCIGSTFCAATNTFALNCGNIFAESNDSACSSTDCNGGCAALLPTPLDYNTATLNNECKRLGLDSVVNCETGPCIVTTEWVHVLSDGDTQIEVTGTRGAESGVFETCSVNLAGGGPSCPCSVACPALSSTISYDCSAVVNDPCAAVDCNSNCVPGGNLPAPPPMATTKAPVVTVTAPVTAPMSAPVVVSPPVQAPTAPVQPPTTKPVVPPTPVISPMAAPVVTPVVAPVVAPVAAPVVAPIAPQPVVAPVAVPVVAPIAPQPVVIAPVTTPVAQPPSPITPPIPKTAPVVGPVSPVSVPTVVVVPPPVPRPSPPVSRPTPPNSNGSVCASWWGLY